MMHRIHWLFALHFVMGPLMAMAFGQSEVSGWGNLRGIRVGDQLLPFTTAVGIYNADLTRLTLSQREGPTRTTRYVHQDSAVSVDVALQYGDRGDAGRRGAATAPAAGGTANYTISYTDSAPGVCDVHIKLKTSGEQPIGGIYFLLTLPVSDFSGATARITGKASRDTVLTAADQNGRFLSENGSGIRISAPNRSSIELALGSATEIVVQKASQRGQNADIQVRFPLIAGNVPNGEAVEASFTIKATAEADTSPVTVTVDSSKTGRAFLGIGGNYRIQDVRQDPLHIQYIFDNMRVAYGRVAMPWNVWQPREDAPPPMLGGAPQTQPSRGRGGGGAMNSIPSAIEIAQTLAKKNIPMIISCWSPPSWATLPNDNRTQRGQRLDPAKRDAICQSIGSYLVYLRDHYGAEPLLFSFNESNMGINVRQTAEDHAEAIKRLGTHFQSLGLKTRMLLGDTADVPPIEFIQTAMNDPQAVKYVGAISFHSWRGATDAQYQEWARAAAKLNVPLIDAEGGNDAQAYSYPNLFREEWYSLDEASEYVRILRICQPLAILQWQFTQNYSVLFDDANNKLQPSQRFFNLKQINLTPAGSKWIDVQSSSALVLPAAYSDPASGAMTIHLVNNGDIRALTIRGLPTTASTLKVYVTDRARGMEQIQTVPISAGSCELTLPPRALVTLVSDKS